MNKPVHYDIAALRAQNTALLARQRWAELSRAPDEHHRAAAALLHDLQLASFELTARALTACNDGMEDGTADRVVGYALGTLHANLASNFAGDQFSAGVRKGPDQTRRGLALGIDDEANLHFKPTQGGTA